MTSRVFTILSEFDCYEVHVKNLRICRIIKYGGDSGFRRELTLPEVPETVLEDILDELNNDENNA